MKIYKNKILTLLNIFKETRNHKINIIFWGLFIIKKIYKLFKKKYKTISLKCKVFHQTTYLIFELCVS